MGSEVTTTRKFGGNTEAAGVAGQLGSMQSCTTANVMLQEPNW